jgi:DNA-binding MarR family transcriptional regulator
MEGTSERKLTPDEIEAETGIRLRTISDAKSRDGGFVERMPLAWILTAANLPGKSMQVAVAIWHQTHIERSNEVALTRRKLRRFGVHRHSANRILRDLENAGLVVVSRKPGRSPRVRIAGTKRELSR